MKGSSLVYSDRRCKLVPVPPADLPDGPDGEVSAPRDLRVARPRLPEHPEHRGPAPRVRLAPLPGKLRLAPLPGPFLRHHRATSRFRDLATKNIQRRAG